VVERARIFAVLEALKTFNHSVLEMTRSSTSCDGFTTEYVIQRTLKNLVSILCRPHDVVSVIESRVRG
jgi:hypothetical protein